eukprot:5196755-Prymnesium_polylepis.1
MLMTSRALKADRRLALRPPAFVDSSLRRWLCADAAPPPLSEWLSRPLVATASAPAAHGLPRKVMQRSGSRGKETFSHARAASRLRPSHSAGPSKMRSCDGC